MFKTSATRSTNLVLVHACDEGRVGRLLRDFVRSLASSVLGRFDLLPALVAQNADEAAYRVRLPLRGGHYLGQRRALGPLHHRDYFSLLVGAIRLRLARAFLRKSGTECSNPSSPPSRSDVVPD